VPPSLCTNLDAICGVQELQDKGKEGSLSCQVKSNCREIHHRTLKMLSRRGQQQMKTNLDRMHMDHGMWWMLVSHMRKESSLATPTHPI
jgi:hypothetical protein